MRPLAYTQADSDRAYKEWKASCGPHAIAAACGKTLDEVRATLVNFKGWMSPTMVCNSLGALGMTDILYQTKLKTDDLCNGINRVQWEGKMAKSRRAREGCLFPYAFSSPLLRARSLHDV